MSNIIGHIIGLDDIHKKKLIKILPKQIKVVDLDTIQQKIYNDKELVKEKIEWSEISKQLLIKKKQKKLIGSKRIGSNNIDKQIQKLMNKRNTVRRKIHNIWKDKMSQQINALIPPDNHILFVGFNIFPKDYRVKINLPVQAIADKTSNKIIYSTKPTSFAANQIKYYLKTYNKKIIEGSFNLSLLNTQYLASKYEKFTDYYQKQGYQPINKNELITTIQKLDKQLSDRDKIINQIVYVAMPYKTDGLIPVNSRTPIEGFFTRDDALTNIKTKMKPNIPIYLYKTKADQFQVVNGKLMAVNEIMVDDEESILLTD